jgi:hypothetical protein
MIAAAGNWTPYVQLSCAPAICTFSPESALHLDKNSARTITLVVRPGIMPPGTSSLQVIATPSGGPGSKSLNLSLNIVSGSGSADLNVSVTHSLIPPGKPSDAAPVGAAVQFTADVGIASGAATNPSLLLLFSAPASLGSLPGGCTADPSSVSCTLAALPATVNISVVPGFVHAFTVQAFVQSGGTETAPADNVAQDTVEIRPRPLARPGLAPR